MACLSAMASAPLPPEDTGNPGWLTANPAPVQVGVMEAGWDEPPEGINIAAAGATGAEAVTPEIVELARGLENSPARIYEFVCNQIRYEPYYGSLKGATRTLLDRAGNDCDQASLLVALLRQSGISARYVYGVLTLPLTTGDGSPNAYNWVGASDPLGTLIQGGVPATNSNGGTAINLDFIGVEAQIGSDWIRLAPSLKTYTSSGMQDLAGMMGYSRSAVLSAAGGTSTSDYVENLNEASLKQKLGQLSSNMLASLRATMPNASMGEVMGERSINPASYPVLPTNLPCAFSSSQTYAILPTNLAHRVQIRYGGISNIFNIADVAHRRITVKYDKLIVGTSSSSGIQAAEWTEGSGGPVVNAMSAETLAPTNESAMAQSPSLTNETVLSAPSFPGDTDTNMIGIASTWSVPYGTNSQIQSSVWTNSFGPAPSSGWSMSLTISLADNPQGAFTLTGGGTFQLSPGQKAAYAVTFSGSGQARGAKSAQVRLTYSWVGIPNSTTIDNYNLSGFVVEHPNACCTYYYDICQAFMNEPATGVCSVVNNGSQTLTIQGISIANNPSSQFQLINGYGSGTVAPGGRRDITFRFVATQHGSFSGNLSFDTQMDGQDYPAFTMGGMMQGTAYYKPSFTGTMWPVFNTCWYGEPATSNIVIRNNGTVPLYVTSSTIAGTDSGRFSKVSGGGAATVAANGGTYTCLLRYNADQEGSHTNASFRLNYTYEGLTLTTDFSLVGQTLSRPRASLLLDEAITNAESGAISGAVATCSISISHPYSNSAQTVYFPFKRGSLYAIMCGFGDAEGSRVLARNQRQLEASRTRNADSGSDVLGKSLHVMGQTWLDESALINRLIEQMSGVRSLAHHRFGVMAQEAGYYVDVKAQMMDYYPCEYGGTSVSAGMKAGSLLSSSLEHAMLEQLQGADHTGVSTVKLLQMANANGDRIYRLTSANAASVLASLTNYPSAVISQFQTNAAMGLVQVLPRNGTITAGQWKGNGYAACGLLPSGQYMIGMIISGDYYGGYGIDPRVLDAYALADLQRNVVSIQAQSVHPASPDPVDLVSGAFLYSNDDLALGGPDPMGLRFTRSYSSLDASRPGVLGYGWTHNYDIRIVEHSAWQGGMGLRTPAEAVPLMVATMVAGDMALNEDNPKGWATAALASKWATDQLTANAITVYMGNKALTFVLLPDGSYNPPPSVTMSLSKTNGLYGLSERNGRRHNFNAALRLASITDPDANAMTLAYNTSTNLSGVTDASGRTLTLQYSGAWLANVVDSTGRSITLQSDSATNLTAFTDVTGSIWRYAYDTNHCMTATIEPGGVTNALNTYDSLSRVGWQANGRGLVSQMLYADYRTVELDPASNRRTHYFDDKQREICREVVPGFTSWAVYDGQDHVIATQDPLGRVNYNIYDDRHNVLWTIDPLSQVNSFTYDSFDRLIAATDPMGNTSATEYDSKHHPVKLTDAMSNQVVNAFRSDGVLQNSVVIPSASAGGGSSITNSWTYDSWRNPTGIIHPDGSQESFSYNARGDKLSWIDARSNTTTYTYDNRRLCLKETDILGGVASNNWNVLGLLASRTDKRGKITSYTYSKTRELAGITAPDGGVVSNIFDSADRVVAVINPRLGVTSNTWDSAGRLIARRDPNGVTTRLTYDSVGNVLATIDGLGNISTNIYDALNRLVEARSPNGAVLTTEYDADSRVTAVVDALGRRTEFTLDALGRKIAVKRADNRTERYAFDGHGNLLAFTNAARNVQSFNYDSMGRKIGESNAVGTVRSYSFDAAGNVSAKTDGNGKLTTLNYNAVNRLTALHYADNSVVTFTNDASGNLIGMGDPWGTVASSASYDNAGRLSAWTDHHNSTIQYNNDKAGAVTNIIYPGNLTVTYGWDTAGRLVSVKDWASRTWNFSYDGANRLSGIQYPNGVNYSRGYNADGQLTNYVHSKSGTPFISRTFERNAAGLKTRETISAGLEVEQPDTWQKHTSDKADRLTGLTRRDEYVIPERWRGYTPSYNPEGQVTNINEGYQAWSSGNNLIWDDAGRLIEYTGLRQTNLWTDMPPMPSWGLELGYDGLGARTVRTDELVTRRLVVDRAGRLRVPLMETDASNTAIRYYIWAPGIGLLAQIEANSTIHYIHADENGSTLAMTDSNGNVTDQFAYSPWGELLGRTGTNTTSFTFVGGGGVTWEGGALYRMGARYYDARLKRWLSADPAGMAGGANLYLYASANPLFWVDLLGLCGQTYLQNALPDYMSSEALTEGPGLVGGAVPMIGPMREAAANRMNGQYGWMAVNTAFAMADVVSLGRATVVRDVVGAGIRETGEVMARDALEGSAIRNTTILGENMMERVIPYAEETGSRTLPFGATADEWAKMTPQQRWRLNDGTLRARINEGDSFRYIGQDPRRLPSVRTEFDLTRSELLRLQDRSISYEVVSPSAVQSVLGRL